MKLTTICSAILIALGLIIPTAHAAQLTTQIVLLDPNTLAPLTPNSLGPNHYYLAHGQTFLVQLQGEVSNPNFTDQQKTSASLRNKALGVENIAGKLVTTGGVGTTFPLTDPGSPFPTWQGFVEYIGTGNPGFANVFDGDGDTDLDVNGVGTANPALSLSSVVQLPGVQLGALGMTPFFEGLYQYTGIPYVTTTISFIPSTLKFYVDPPSPAAANALAVEDGLASYFGTPVVIDALPEPSTYALAGLGLVGLVMAMRRKNNS